MGCASSSNSKSYDNHQRSCNRYRDPNMNIWYIQDNLPVTTLCVALRKKLKYDQILKHFSAFGEVKTVRMQRGIHNKPSYFYCFVTFMEAESAAKGLAAKCHAIAGHRVRVAIASSRHQSKKLMMTTAASTSTHFSSLNDDCLFQIFSQKSISIKDLCSVARSSVRLKGIANNIFKQIHEEGNVCRLYLSEIGPTFPEARRIVVTFGSIISGLRIDCIGVYEKDKEEWENLLDLVGRYCSETLEFLDVTNLLGSLTIRIPSPLRKLKILNIFNCNVRYKKKVYVDSESLLELNVTGYLSIENTFPMLERLSYDKFDPTSFTEFISRHKKLKILSISSKCGDPLPLFPLIADKCKQLEEFDFAISSEVSSDEHKKSIRSLQNLKSLRKLVIKCKSLLEQNVTSVIQELKFLNSLECLHLSYAIIDSECIPTLSQLKSLQELRLGRCKGFNLNQLGDLHQLTKLTIAKKDCDLNFVELIKRLNKLNTLCLRVRTFKMDKKLYLGMVEVIQSRPEGFPLTLEIACCTGDATAADLQYDRYNCHRVKLSSFGKILTPHY